MLLVAGCWLRSPTNVLMEPRRPRLGSYSAWVPAPGMGVRWLRMNRENFEDLDQLITEMTRDEELRKEIIQKIVIGYIMCLISYVYIIVIMYCILYNERI